MFIPGVSLNKIKEIFTKMMRNVEDGNTMTVSETVNNMMADNSSATGRDKAAYSYSEISSSSLEEYVAPPKYLIYNINWSYVTVYRYIQVCCSILAILYGLLFNYIHI